MYANILLREQHVDEAKKWLESLPAEANDNPQVQAMQAQLEFIHIVENAPDMASLQQQLAEDPGNTQARYQLSAHAILQGQFETAFEQLLEVVKRDRQFQDDAGRNGFILVPRVVTVLIVHRSMRGARGHWFLQVQGRDVIFQALLHFSESNQLRVYFLQIRAAGV